MPFGALVRAAFSIRITAARQAPALRAMSGTFSGSAFDSAWDAASGETNPVLRRLGNLSRQFSRQAAGANSLGANMTSADEPRRVCIGDVCIDVRPPKNPEKVPLEFGGLDIYGTAAESDEADEESDAREADEEILEHLQWMMQKDIMGQDIFLMGPPGPLRRHLALAYCNLVQREHEYIPLHRDTSAESDLKQRREITNTADAEEARSGIVRPEGMGKLSAEWVDAAAVRAAVEGRILILEGIEKAERNVLPVLNNLLENREINLEDGRHLVHPDFYDRLLKLGNTQAQLDEWKLVRVHPQFRVIALGIPVPPYRGNPLDPPFRSRFQVRWIDGWGAVGRPGGRIGRGILVGERADEMDEEELISEIEGGKKIEGGRGRGERVREMVRNVVMLAETVRVGNRMDDPTAQLSSTASSGSLLPAFPQPSIPTLVDLAQTFPDEFLDRKSAESAVERVYPYATAVGGLTSEQKGAWINLLEKFGIREPVPKAVVPQQKNPNTFYSDDDIPAPPPPPPRRSRIQPTKYALEGIKRIEKQAANALVGSDEDDPAHIPQMLVAFRSLIDANERVEMLVAGGPNPPVVPPIDSITPSTAGLGIVQTPRFASHLVPLLQHACMGQDVMVVGPRGSGKSTLVNLFAQALGYHNGFVEKVDCYKDMTARDLLQRRGTRRGGSTYWENSGLVVAALEGKMCVLEGVHNLEAGALASIARLAQDRELPLPDGSMLVSERSFMDMRKLTGLTHAELVRDKRILPVHPSFRIVATASYPLHASQSGTVLDRLPWMTEEICGLFAFVDIPGPDRAEEEAIIKRLVPLNTPMEAIVSILDFAHKFRDISEGAGDGAQAGGSVLNKAGNLGTRQLIRILRRVAEDPEEDLHRAINRTLLSPFLPQLARMALQELLQESGIRPRPREVRRGVPPPEVKGNHLVVGNVKMPIFDPAKSDPEGEALVPRVSAAFFDNDLHTLVMRELIADFALGEQLILIGNQGVGKNRLTDRFLELINRPREYIQLHRDTTVQSLMVQPTVENGLIIYKDSPLVRAVKTGRVLVVDEADKAPVYITSVLKSLAETGEMTLTDGRKIRPASEVVSRAAHSRDIIVHPDFRLILLANRPGYPFLGNDFFSAIGDVFATHAVENPDVESEMALLSQAAPELSQETIKKLVLAFGDLRQAFDDGLVNYPYSLRELMHLVRHMKRFPEDEIDTVLRNVFDFDVMRKEYHEILLQILNKHGIPVSSLGVEAARRASGAKGGKKRNVMLKFEGDAADGMRRPQRGGRNMPNMRGRGRGGGAQAMPRNIAKVVDPKEGKVDPKNKPHRGGNTWRGGTGGSSTAGLGGRAGPYRLDLGHDVMQISDELKEQVPEEVKQAARQMAREGLERRLKEINMTAYDAAAYKEFYNNVQQEIRQLRVVLEGIQAKEKERVWLKNMTDGDLDDSKLIDGLTGEHAIYKRRGDEQPEFGATQKKPKRIKFVVDISGSMYRFNGLDGRLNRTLEAALMVMEALHGLDIKYKYELIGHSGDSDAVPLVTSDKPPKNEGERLRVLQQMVAHSQFCFSGDNTLEATEKAIKEITKEEGDDYIVIVLSDANLRRYGIRPETLGKILSMDPRVTASVIFIGTLGEEAEILRRRLPSGKGHVAMNTADVPMIIKQILTTII